MGTKGSTRQFVIGDIYLMNFGENKKGSAQRGWRPGVVFQNNVGNAHSPNIIALPLTSAIKKMDLPTHVLLESAKTGLRMDSVVLCENPEIISKNDVGSYITRLPDEYMEQVAIASLIATSAIAFVSIPQLVELQKRVINLNAVIAR